MRRLQSLKRMPPLIVRVLHGVRDIPSVLRRSGF
jgi:hypothetical protein